MFYAAMYALKGREDRRAASALQQMTGVDLGGQPGMPACWVARAALRAAPLPSRCPLAESLLRAPQRPAKRCASCLLGMRELLAHHRVPRLQGSACPPTLHLISCSPRPAVAQQEQRLHLRERCRSRCRPSSPPKCRPSPTVVSLAPPATATPTCRCVAPGPRRRFMKRVARAGGPGRETASTQRRTCTRAEA